MHRLPDAPVVLSRRSLAAAAFKIGSCWVPSFPGMLARRSIKSYLPKRNNFREVPDGITPIPIAIVGRPNVGKSTLFNRLLSGTRKKKMVGQRNAIVSDRGGTTRDRKEEIAVFGGLVLRLIDTGGLESELATRQSTLLSSMREQAVRAIAGAEAVLFVFDAREGVTPLDLEVARALQKDMEKASFYRQQLGLGSERESVPVILVANKAEGAYIGPYLNDCYDLGFGDPVILSAKQNEGMEDLYDRLSMEVGHLQKEEEEEGSDEKADEASGGAAFWEDGEGASGGNEALEDADVAEKPPTPTLKWLPPGRLTEQQKESLRWYANHPANPLGQLDEGLKRSVLHKEANDEVPRYWLSAPQRALPDKDVRDYVLGFRRLEEQEHPMRLAFVGSPNAGKSSIINALLQEERCIVDEADGTTMDSVVTDWEFKGQPVRLIDTCGVTRGWNYPGSYSDLLEAGMGTKKAIRKSHVVVVCIDPTGTRKLGYFSCPVRFDIKLVQFAIDEGKAVMIVINKWDLINEEDQGKIRDQILKKVQDQLSDCKGIPIVFMSAKHNLNLSMMMIRAHSLFKRWGSRLPTGKLNAWLQAWMIRWPAPWKNGQKQSVKYMTQTRARPPTFVVWTNTTWDGMPRHYIRQLQNSMREEFRIQGVPMKFIMRSTLMPKPGKKLTKKDILKWKRVGPRQRESVKNLNSKRMLRRLAFKEKQTE